MSYDLMREFADSWGLIYLFGLFVGLCLFLLRPGAKKHADYAANIPFNEDIVPMKETPFSVGEE